MQSSLLYSDNIIYSPKVPWFRAADYSLLSHPISASFITSAAPNSGRLKDVTAVQLLDVIRTRVGKILAVAEANGHRTLLLGAWGCGVFRNDPTVVSDAFSSWLQSPRFAGSFDSVTFSIADNSKNKHVLKAFELTFTTSGHE